MTAGVAVELKDLSRHYGPVRALDGLTLQMEPGQLVALLGPSGCGKTTALRILAGLDEASAGSVWVDGRDISRVPANKRDIGMVFQAYSLFPHLTVRDNVAFGLKMRGMAKRDRQSRALEMLDLVGLAAQSDRYAGELSGGQQQRVALARALAIQPRVLLLDEPLSALDAKVRTQLRDEIRRVQQEVGITTLFVTHDQEEALAVADRVGVMNAGRLEQLAAPADLYTAPATPFVAEFVGLSNRVPAEVVDGRVLLWGKAVPALPGSVTGAGTALVRPESVRLEATGEGVGLAAGASEATGLAAGASGATGLAAGASEATGSAVVQSVSFLGAVSRVRVALAGSEASGSEAGATVLAQVGGGALFTVGQRVRVSVESHGVLVV